MVQERLAAERLARTTAQRQLETLQGQAAQWEQATAGKEQELQALRVRSSGIYGFYKSF